MSDSTLELAFTRVLSSAFLSQHLTILWHAGEPLVPGVGYYERVLAILDRLKPSWLTVTHHVQTNGTLIDQGWIDFFKANGVKLGVSVDGPAHLHDLARKTRRRGGSFAQVMRGVRLLCDNHFPFHVITVLTRESLYSARELFAFYVDNGIERVCFNIEEIEGNHTSSSLQYENVDAAMRNFLHEFLDLVETHPGKIEVREFSGAFHAIADPQSGQYGNPLAEPLRMINVGVDGELGTFSPELLGYQSKRHGSFIFGNVHDDDLDDIFRDPKFIAVNAEIASGLNRCRQSCDYFELCRGGAPANKLFENGGFDSTETLFCRLVKKAVIDVVLERLEQTLALTS